MKDKLISLQILRGVAALLIVIGHATILLGAGVGVELFFIISAFIMMYVTRNGLNHFLVKRIIRIVPLYWIVNIVFLILVDPASFTVPYFIQSLFFLNPIDRMPFLTVGWTLNHEVRFYLIFWLSAKISQRYRGVISGAACLVWGLVNLARFRGALVPPLIPFAFTLGILAYFCYERLQAKPLNRTHKLLLVSLVAVTAVFLHSDFADRLLWNTEAGNWSLFRPMIYGIPAFFIFLSVMLLIREPSNPLVTGLARVGDISYSLYLWHIVVQESIVIFFEKVGYTITLPSTPRFMALTLTVSLIVANYSYKYLEQPLSDYLKRLYQPASPN